jgi:hypothetical protein
MRLPRKITGLLMAAGIAAAITTAAAPAHAATPIYVGIATTTPGSNLCLEADPASDVAFRVYTQPCNVANNWAQQWTYLIVDTGVVKIENHELPGWCIEAHAITDNSPVIMWPCSSTESNLRWEALDAGFGLTTFESRISGSFGHCLDVPGDLTLAAWPMHVYTCNSTAAQRFVVTATH